MLDQSHVSTGGARAQFDLFRRLGGVQRSGRLRWLIARRRAWRMGGAASHRFVYFLVDRIKNRFRFNWSTPLGGLVVFAPDQRNAGHAHAANAPALAVRPRLVDDVERRCRVIRKFGRRKILAAVSPQKGGSTNAGDLKYCRPRPALD